MIKEKKITKKQLKKLEKKELNRKDNEWKEKLKKESNSSCIICGKSEIIHCHHLYPREIKYLRHEILNGVTLCPNHHRFSREISAHQNSIEFLLWYMKNFKERFNLLLKKANNLGVTYTK